MKELFFKQDDINYSFEKIKKEIISIPIQNLLAKDLKSIEKPPLPSGRWAGIGTRALSDHIKAQVLNSFEGLEK